MPAHFHLITIEETITDESAARGDVATSDASEAEPMTFGEALKALTDGCWDNLDARGTQIIAYPADWSQDFRTGVYEADTLVISANSERNLDRLMDAYETARGA